MAFLMRLLLSLLNILFMLKMFYDHLKSNRSVNSPDMRKHSWEKDFLLSSFLLLNTFTPGILNTLAYLS